MSCVRDACVINSARPGVAACLYNNNNHQNEPHAVSRSLGVLNNRYYFPSFSVHFTRLVVGDDVLCVIDMGTTVVVDGTAYMYIISLRERIKKTYLPYLM